MCDLTHEGGLHLVLKMTVMSFRLRRSEGAHSLPTRCCRLQENTSTYWPIIRVFMPLCTKKLLRIKGVFVLERTVEGFTFQLRLKALIWQISNDTGSCHTIKRAITKFNERSFYSILTLNWRLTWQTFWTQSATWAVLAVCWLSRVTQARERAIASTDSEGLICSCTLWRNTRCLKKLKCNLH